MRHAVGLKAYSSQQPLDEFRLEANRAFLLLLDTYRSGREGVRGQGSGREGAERACVCWREEGECRKKRDLGADCRGCGCGQV